MRESMRDERWDSCTCPLGFGVMGIWPQSRPGEGHADGTDVNAVCRGTFNGQARRAHAHRPTVHTHTGRRVCSCV